MTREKQIEEMACKKCLHYEGCLKRFREAKQTLGMYSSTPEEEYFGHADDCDMFITGYRKASDVAREIFDELMDTFKDIPMWGAVAVKKIAELKKKYTEVQR